MKKQLFITVFTVLISLQIFATGVTIASFSPSSGTTGTGIFIKGSGFTNNTSAVTIGGANISVFSVLDNNTIYAVVPSNATSGSVTVTNAAANSTVSLSGFTYSTGVNPTPLAPSVGNGTVGNPYQIANLQNLYWLSTTTSVWTGGAYFIQTANIDAAAASIWTGGAGLFPIGSSALSFTGHYDGQGFSINNLYINRGDSMVSLFGRVDTGASISNLNLTNETIISSSSGYLSGFVAQIYGSSTVTNCTLNGGFVYGPGSFAGFVGSMGSASNGGATITNCSSNLAIFGTSSNVGGFVSYLDVGGIIKNSYCQGSVNGTGYVGGFVGRPVAGSITNCYSKVNVYGSSQINGGFLSYSNSATTIITNCYALGTVAGTNFTGGFGGYNSANIVFTNCYWDTNVSGLAYGFGSNGSLSGVTGKTTTQMTTQSTFNGWDFVGETTNGSNDYWNINPSNNGGYPYLSWQYFASAPTVASFTPTTGNTGTSVTVVGTGFSGVTGITVGGVAVTSYTVNSLTSLTFTIPTGALSGNIVITNSIGTVTSSGTFVVANSDANLSALSLSSGSLSPTFVSGTTSYSSSVANTVTSITVTPTVADSNATVKVNGTTVTSGQASNAIALNTGSNTITVVVTAQDGTTTNTYTTTITRAASTNANLSSLSLSSGSLSPTFVSGTTSYNSSVANTVTSITVTPTLADSNATVKVNGTTVTSGQASNAIALNVGSNTITIVVTAQDGTTTNTYTTTITRAASTNANLSSLSLSSGSLSPTFASGTTSYSSSVANTVTSITVTPTVADSNATVKVNGTTVTSGQASNAIALNTGSNTITVVVTAQDGTTVNNYIITISRVDLDTDSDGIVNAVDTDDDNDGTLDGNDAFPLDRTEWTDTDHDGIGNNADPDDDNDGILDACDVDTNGDGIPDNGTDLDADGINDGCDPDIDGDGVINSRDNCPNTPNTNQADRDSDGLGDVCDTIEINASQAITPNGDGINDTWVIYNLANHPGSTVRVFTANGAQVFYSANYQNNWTGNYQGSSEMLPVGSYLYQIDLGGDGSIDTQGWLYITK
jgi:gliding motility-associated-like protein